MDEVKKSDEHAICTPFAPSDVTARTYEGKLYYGTIDVAKILGVTRQTVSNWHNSLFHDAPIFKADLKTHDGRLLYEFERVEQLKAIYRANWTLGSYEPAPFNDMKKNVTQQLENLPDEILSQPRFFKLYGDKKSDTPKGWSNPENQFHFHLLNFKEHLLGFDICGHGRADDYCLLDFDNVLDDNGNFINDDAENIFEGCAATVWTYCERSISGHGLHMLLKPTKGKFNPISNGKSGVLHFDREKGAKLEIFYLPKARYCLLTGGVFKCTPRTQIASGDEADFLLEYLLKKNAKQNTEMEQAAEQKSAQEPEKNFSELGSDYDLFRAGIMLDIIKPAELSDSDWLAVMTACKNLGIPHNVVEAFNRRDPNRYNETENLKRIDSVNDPYGIETLHGIAKCFGYQEADARRQWYQLHPETQNKNPAQKKPADKYVPSEENFNGNDYLEGTTLDLDNARRLEKFCGNKIRWLSDEENWLLYDNGIWTRQSKKNSALYPLAAQFADNMLQFAQKLGLEAKKAMEAAVTKNEDGKILNVDETKREQAKIKQAIATKSMKIALAFRKKKDSNAALEMLKSCKSILLTADKLNRQKHLLCVQNGVVDLRTGELLPFNPKYLITNQAGAIFDEYADTAFIEKFFADILPNEQTRAAVLRYLGYSLTGEKNFHISEFWKGEGSNGKSTLIDLLLKLLGSYAVKLPSNALMQSYKPFDANAANPVLCLLEGDIRLALLDEMPRNCRIDGSLFKTVTGDETISARQLYSTLKKIELRAKLILNGNSAPSLDSDEKSMRRRINNVPFNQTFEGEKADPRLPEKLSTSENLSALLKILVEESKQFFCDGLLESDEMKAAKQEYISENDFVRTFIDENCEVGNGGEITRKAFEDKLRADYPRDFARYKKKELLDLIISRLEALGAAYLKGNHNKNIFRNIKWLEIVDTPHG